MKRNENEEHVCKSKNERNANWRSEWTEENWANAYKNDRITELKRKYEIMIDLFLSKWMIYGFWWCLSSTCWDAFSFPWPPPFWCGYIAGADTLPDCWYGCWGDGSRRNGRSRTLKCGIMRFVGFWWVFCLFFCCWWDSGGEWWNVTSDLSFELRDET